MSEIRRVACCGISELANIANDIEPLKKDQSGYAGEYVYKPEKSIDTLKQSGVRGAFFIFSTPEHTVKYGEALADYIKEKGLGETIRTEPRYNPNSGSKLTMWVWAVDQDALKAWSLGATLPELEALKEKRSEAAKKGWQTRLATAARTRLADGARRYRRTLNS